jgi:hypothetical protein
MASDEARPTRHQCAQTHRDAEAIRARHSAARTGQREHAAS